MRNSSNLSIREVKVSELSDFIAEIELFFREMELPWEPDRVRAALNPLLVPENRLGAGLWIEDAGSRIGYSVIGFGFDHEFGGRIARMTDFFIRSEFRGKGTGDEALKQIEAWVKQQGILAIELQVLKNHSRPIAFYTRAGYETLDRVLMMKFLK